MDQPIFRRLKPEELAIDLERIESGRKEKESNTYSFQELLEIKKAINAYHIKDDWRPIRATAKSQLVVELWDYFSDSSPPNSSKKEQSPSSKLESIIIPELTEEELSKLTRLPADALRIIADQSDWLTAAAMCQALPSLCKGDYWQARAQKEMPKEEWFVGYQFPFHNYLALRVRHLEKKFGKVKFLKKLGSLNLNQSFSLEELGILPQQILGRKAIIFKSPAPSELNQEQINDLFRKVQLFEQSYQRDFPNYSEKVRAIILRKYFLKQFEKEYNELYIISKFLANYLEKNYRENFRVIKADLTIRELSSFTPDKGSNLLSEKQTRRLIKIFSLRPDDFLIISKRYFFNYDGQIYRGFGFGYASGKNTLADFFKKRMLELGIIREYYKVLYPELYVKEELTQEPSDSDSESE